MPTVFMLVVLMLPGQQPIMHSQPAESLSACISDVTEMLERFQAMRKVGRLQASCTVIGAEAEAEVKG